MELVLLIGLPASGKSSFFQHRLADTHTKISKDLMKGKRNRDHKQRVLLEECASRDQPVVLDNTHPSKASRAPWIRWAQERKWKVKGYYLSCSVEECQRRNARRDPSEIVPDVGFLLAADFLTCAGFLASLSPLNGFDRIGFLRRHTPSR